MISLMTALVASSRADSAGTTPSPLNCVCVKIFAVSAVSSTVISVASFFPRVSDRADRAKPDRLRSSAGLDQKHLREKISRNDGNSYCDNLGVVASTYFTDKLSIRKDFTLGAGAIKYVGQTSSCRERQKDSR